MVPTQGKGLKSIVMALAVLAGGFSALCYGLLRMFLSPGLATPSMAARALNLPVLATAGIKSEAWV